MSGGPDTDDWFGDLAPEERQTPDVQSDDDGPRIDDWLTDARSHQPRRPWAQTVDRRMVTVGASAIAALIAVLAAAGIFSGGGGNAPAVTSPSISTAQATTAPTAATATTLPAPATTLKPGDTGPQVAVLQRALASLGFSSGKADGKYGPATTNAVARFQRSVALVADGILGPATLRGLENALRGP